MNGIGDGHKVVAKSARDHLNEGAGLQFTLQPEGSPYLPPQLFFSWSGFVQFANLRGLPGRVAPSGTITNYIDIDRNAGQVSYCDGTNITNWPEGHEIYAAINLPSGDFIVH